MNPYRIELTPAAVRALTKIHPEDKERIHGAIALLGHDPLPPKAIALSGRPGYGVRVSEYRTIYTIQDDNWPSQAGLRAHLEVETGGRTQ